MSLFRATCQPGSSSGAGLLSGFDAVAEARLVALIAHAAPTDWTAAAFLLERQHPERWSRDHAPIADEFDEADD